MARLSRYSRWDGTQAVPDLDADELLSAMSDDLLAEGDLMNALRRLFQRGARDPQGGRMPGLQDLLKRLQQSRPIAQDVSRGNRYRALKLGRRESPRFSLVSRRAINQALGDVVSVAPPAFGRSLHVQRLAIRVK